MIQEKIDAVLEQIEQLRQQAKLEQLAERQQAKLEKLAERQQQKQQKQQERQEAKLEKLAERQQQRQQEQQERQQQRQQEQQERQQAKLEQSAERQQQRQQERQQQLELKLAAMEIVFPDLTATLHPLQTLENYRCLFDHYDVDIRYNEMTKETEITIPNFPAGDLYNNAVLAQLTSYANKHGLKPMGVIDHYINEIAHHNNYHPVRNWIETITWDGQDHLKNYYNSIILREVNPLKETMMYKWALSCVAALYHTNFSAEGVLTLTGLQGAGKTTWLLQLLLKEHQYKWNKDAVVLDLNSKDSIAKALSYWITELGELDATFGKKQIEHLKGFITESYDVYRAPYDRKANKYPRRTVFYGTVNADQFLQDIENRRFWVLAVERFNTGLVNPEQFWAQMYQEYLKVKDKIATPELRVKNNCWGWHLSPAERRQLAPLQEQHRSIDPISEILEANIAQPTINNRIWMNATEILKKLSITLPNKRDANSAAAWLQKNNYEKNGNKQYAVSFINDQEDNFDTKPILNPKLKQVLKLT